MRIAYKEILHAESDKNRCIIHCVGGAQYITYRKLDDIEAELNDMRFLRCKKSYLVNMDFIKAVHGAFEMTSGAVVEIRQKDSSAIRAKYNAYINGTDVKQQYGGIKK